MFLSFLLFEDLGPFLLDDAHFGLEGFFVYIREDLVGFGVATTIDIFFQTSLSLCDMEFVEGSFQIVYLFLLWCLLPLGDFTCPCQYLFLVLVLLTLRFRFFFHHWCFFHHRCLCFYCGGCCFCFHHVLFYVLLLFESFFLRVHCLLVFSS